jgi:hypothetical protein
MVYRPGQSGNPGGRVHDKPWRDAIMLAIKDGDPLRLRKLAEKVVAMAEGGDMSAITEIANRLDGKPAQQQIITGAEGGPVRYEKVERVIVRSSDAANSNGSGIRAIPSAGAL